MEFAKKILFPVDLSEVSPKIAPYVKEVASKFGAEVHLVFVARVLQYFTSIYVPHPSVSNFESEIIKGAEKKLEEFVNEHFRGFSPRVKIILLMQSAIIMASFVYNTAMRDEMLPRKPLVKQTSRF